MSDPTIRFRVDFGRDCSIGIGKVELLEGIARCGSLSEAARQMHMSYRRAWLLLADLNGSFDEPVARASTGGRGGGGAILTPFGKRLISGYRNMEAALQPLAASHLKTFASRVKSANSQTRSKTTPPVASIKRRAGARRKSAPGA
jgi:molybdate transport system regulatory protein